MSECNTIHEEVIFVIVSNLARFLVDIFFTFCKEMKSFSHDFFTKFFSRDKSKGGKRKFIEGHKKVIGYKKT